jgi:acid phosphatase (class A)
MLVLIRSAQRSSIPTVVIFVIACVAAPAPFAADGYLRPGEVDAVALLCPPPLVGSAEQAADLESVQRAFKDRTAEDVARGHAELEFNLFSFAPNIGPFFQPGKFPKTEALFKRALSDTKTITDAGKNHWKRPRPYDLDPHLLDGDKEPSFAYPSGHSTRATVYSLLLVELFSDDCEKLLAQGRQIGWDRVILGKHYPTDIYAGRVLGQAVVRQLLADEKFQRDLAAAKVEIEQATHQPAMP